MDSYQGLSEEEASPDAARITELVEIVINSRRFIDADLSFICHS
jgi:hypothetical protein